MNYRRGVLNDKKLMHKPPHPGSIIKDDVLPALKMTVTEAAKQLGVSRSVLSRIANQKASVSINLARRLEAWLGGPEKGPTREVWLRMQMDYDLWQECRSYRIKVKPIKGRQ